MQSQSINSETPILLNAALAKSNPVISLLQRVESCDLERDFLEIITEITKAADCLLLFEVPGSLFEKPEHRAAVLVNEFDETQDHVVFILCNQTSGTLEVYDETEVPEHVNEFVGSYANVLACLRSLESSRNLH